MLVSDKVTVNTGEFSTYLSCTYIERSLCPKMFISVNGSLRFYIQSSLTHFFSQRKHFFIPHRALRMHLAGLQDLLHVSSLPHESFNLPKDPCSCASQFCLDPITQQFLSCPTCHYIFPYNPSDASDNLHNPAILHCIHQQTPQSGICDTPLWEQCEMGGERKIYVPCRKYLHQTLKFWLGHLLLWKGIKDYLDTFPCGPSEDLDAPIYDIWVSKVFCTLKDASGNSFLLPHGKEGQIVFSLSVDGFNPFYNKAAGHVASSTGIWLVSV